MGFRGVRGAGGVGGGGFHSTSQPRSSSSSSSDDLIRNAAVTANSPKSLWSAYSADDVKHCKILVSIFEMCTRGYKEKGGKENPFCQSYLQDLEKDCAKFKPSWSDWWTNELEKGYCFALK
ncbi:uncharacterized protein LOC111318290 isoform X4 [Durio zibethinus]|uniref:Uncharacterized protein LOC111318290 isoform X4 n=1 Tax=Durio zibethinus TaxID=66656 RepID=A0A6P6BI85_DURZI|nr:uncharacterized protein LOC111318290 isoform X4 [Durio zibethinus]XP_022776797.1 uncharacterized protein LOC111318290 isoform X4 [Durio zibethinus]